MTQNKDINIITKKLVSNILQYKKILLAFSGGIDSTVLLDILHKIKINQYYTMQNFSLRAIHINHGINENANNWENHCIQECYKRNIPIKTTKIHNNTYSTKKNLEETMRIARYKILTSNLLKNEVLFTAQHQDDQVETCLLALKRGSGPNGLKSMLPKTILFKKYLLVRPLLRYSQQALQKYAIDKKLHWIEDSSNKNIKFDRNFLRLQVLPIIQTRWPWFSNSVERTTKLCAEQEKLLDELLQNTLTKIIQLDGSLKFTKLITISTIQRTAILKRWIKQYSYIPSYQQLQQLWKDVVISRQDATPKFQLGNHFLCRFQDKLYIIPSKQINQKTNNITIPWKNTKKILTLPQNLGTIFRYSIQHNHIKKIQKYNLFNNYYNFSIKTRNILKKFNILVQQKHSKNIKIIKEINKNNISTNIVRKPRKYEKVSIQFIYSKNFIYINNQKHKTSLQKIFKTSSIPPWERKNIPLLFYNNKLISAIGIFTTKEGNPKNKQCLLYWRIQKKIFI
ncbi:MAG: tRNA(Ile)-lysidine synthetase [Candidatus Westeberhardia cardiocondylae]|nr:tRNA(Ile)-lysidine synthetase [Candidatus Westeberhardia cardiocondylae]